MLVESYCFSSLQLSFLSLRKNVAISMKELDFPTNQQNYTCR